MFSGRGLVTPSPGCSSCPVLDASSGLLHWPVLIMYPESSQQDAIEAFCEEDTIAAHLDVVREGVREGRANGHGFSGI